MKNSNDLLDYIVVNRKNLDINEIAKLVASPDVDINAQDSDGWTALHHLVSGSAAFEYSRLLIVNGCDVTKSDKEKVTPLHIIVAQENWEALLFLLLSSYYNQRIPLPTDISENPQIKASWDLINFEFSEDSKCGKIFKKLIGNYFNFDDLEIAEIVFLNEIKNLNAKHTIYKNPSSSSGSDSESEVDPREIFGALDLGNNLELIANFRQFLKSFAYQINNRNYSVQTLPELTFAPHPTTTKLGVAENYI
jgi:hypothetical protein